MTQEDKELLLKDLCARLPYGVTVVLDEKFGFNKGIRKLVKELLDLYCVECMKPYLRPMSSMTREEEIEYDATFATIKLADGHYDSTMTYKSFDFLNAHHFDYRGLIEKGLAIAITEKNNPYKK